MTTLPEEAVKAEVQLDPNAVIAAVRECARITAPEVTDAEFEALRADNDPLYANTTRDMERAIRAYLSALPLLPVQVAVKKLEWTKGVVDIASPHPGMKYVACSTTPKGSWAFWLDHAPETRSVFTSEEAAKAAAQADYSARILSALEPSAGRAAVLEEGYRQGIEAAAQIIETKQEGFQVRGGGRVLIDRSEGDQSGLGYAAAIRALSSPGHADADHAQARDVLDRFRDYVIEGITAGTIMRGAEHHNPIWQEVASVLHADAGKVEGDARADLERFWRPISEADKSITFDETFDIGDGKSMTIRNSDHFWVRDADGRVYEATWSDHKGGYWWDLEGESPVDPVEYMPHPLSLPSAPSEGAE